VIEDMQFDHVVKKLDEVSVKVDRMSEALLTLTRVEERQAMTAESMNRVWAAIESQAARIGALETARANIIHVHVLWGLLAGAGGVIGYLFNMVMSR
jgi:hypothetical protein